VGGDVSVQLNTAGTITLTVLVGTPITSSLAFTADAKWHKIQVTIDKTASGTAKVYVDDVLWATANGDTSGTSSSWVCTSLLSTTCDLYWDDILFDDTASAVLVPEGSCIMLLPASGNNANSWTDGGGGTGDLHGSIDNIPPTGAATPANGSQIKNAAGTGNLDYTATMQTYAAGGFPIGATCNAVASVCNDAEEVSTATKAGGIWIASNPAQAAGGQTFDFGNDSGGQGAFPTNWFTHLGVVTSNPVLDPVTAPTVTVRKTTASTRVVDVDFMGIYVDYVARPGGLRVQQAVTRANFF